MERNRKAAPWILLLGLLIFFGISSAIGQHISPDLYTDSTMVVGDNRTFNLFDVGPNQDIYMKVYGYEVTKMAYFSIGFAIDTSKIKWKPIWDPEDKRNKGFLTKTTEEKNILNNNTTKAYLNTIRELGDNRCADSLSTFFVDCLLFPPPITESQEGNGSGLMAILHFETSSSFTSSDTAGITIIRYDIKNAVVNYHYYKTKYIYSTINYYSPLPVTLLSLNAKEQKNGAISIEWEISNESNILGYYVERRYEEGEYRDISFVSDPVRRVGENEHFEYIDTEAIESGTYYYRIRIVEIDGSVQYTDAVQVEIKFPDKFTLAQNYPNPFNGDTRITFSIPEEMEVELKIYDVAGKLVTTLITGRMNGGSHIVHVGSEGLASGTYFYRLKAGVYNKIMKMSVIK